MLGKCYICDSQIRRVHWQQTDSESFTVSLTTSDNAYTQGRTETCGRFCQANNVAPPQTDILDIFVQHLFSRAGIKCFYINIYISPVNVRTGAWKRGLTGTIFPIYSSYVLASLIGWRPG
jgi:hypothetical protein